ncbi:peptidylprolyl isomerase [Crateriforma conspicua]|uniref:Peptidyl-prolyl cis-trans isomerase n=1 Tax=Crateriforma conspicua TaxID=2527996 RepID=A0A5C6FQC8_9PLAN|nr:peptidylprolyl isomerase [Crateriforma conspicua]TWU62673.1 Peptidyl-prolyl cis-trans isomerase cyp18 [Crateriforma conspicua]
MYQRFVCLGLAFASLVACALAPNASAQDETVNVLLQTSEGDILLELNKTKAPKTVDNFLKYVEDDFYNGTVFHRVIKNFMIQGGGLGPDLKKKLTRSPIRNEASNGLSNKTYTVAMARTGDPHSATAQFFINVSDRNPSFLDRANAADGWGYAVFGKVIDGFETVDKIKSVPTQVARTPEGFPMEDVPVEPVTILGTKVVKQDKLTK